MDLLDELKKKYGKYQRIMIELNEISSVVDKLKIFGIQNIKQEGKYIDISYDANLVSATTILSEFIGKISVVDFKVQEPNIDDVIRGMYKTLPSIK